MDAPTLAGFMAWVRSAMGINTTVLPDNSTAFGYAYNVAIALVNQAFMAVPPIYTIMVYNLAGNNLVNWAPDQAGQTFFADLRKSMDLNSFVAGVVQSTADVSTSESMLVPDQFKNMTIHDLQLLKTPWGRTYLGYAQAYGPNWGIS